MATVAQDRPCIHVCLIGSADEGLYRWVEIGAEEEGVPTRKVSAEAVEPVPAAYEAAQSSRFDIGVSVAPGKVVLHERHMPAEQPVLSFDLGTDPQLTCRLMGSNAARMVVHLPFGFSLQEDTADKSPRRRFHHTVPTIPAATQPVDGDVPIDMKMLVTIIARILRERGVV